MTTGHKEWDGSVMFVSDLDSLVYIAKATSLLWHIFVAELSQQCLKLYRVSSCAEIEQKRIKR